MAFYEHQPPRPGREHFVGLDNFGRSSRDPLFWKSFCATRRSGRPVSIVLQTVIGVALALLLHLPLRGISIFRGLLLFPYIVPTVVIALVMQWMLNPEIGVVN